MSDYAISASCRGGGRRLLDRRAAVSLVLAAAMPALVAIMALGIDVSYWTTVRVELQRTADIAAMAGAMKYASTNSPSKALTTAANVAEMNGLPVGTRAGYGTTRLTDTYGNYSATFSFTSSPTQITATVQRSVTLMFGAALVASSRQTQTISAGAGAQLSSRSNSSKACAVALNGNSSGITTIDDLTVSGGKNTRITMSGCDLRSDASMNFNGTPGVAVPNLIASGSITGSYTNDCTATGTCDQQFTAVPQIPDPLAGTYGSDLSVPTTTIAQPSGTSLSPPPSGEAYSSLSFASGTYTLGPGVYYVSGQVTFNSNSIVNGTGVTIVMGSNGGLTMNGTVTVNLTAPATGSTAGMLFGSNGAISMSLNGDSSATLGGAIYLPNGSVNLVGNTSPSSNCLEVVALNISFGGSSSLSNASCGSLGVPDLNDYPSIAKLVQ